MKKSTLELEKALLGQGYGIVIGIDEAGRGPLAGPVVACAATVRNFQIPNPKSQTNSKFKISNDKNWDLVRDSKMLSEKQREKLFNFIHKHFFVGIGVCDHRTIDRINILEASFLAMKKAVASLMRGISKSQFPNPKQIQNSSDKNFLLPPTFSPKGRGRGEGRCIILVDGNKKIPNLSIEQRAIVSGDKIVKSISAASIIAKVTRDRVMKEMHIVYSEYGFDKHKGYGTKLHFEMLEKFGPCEIHRKSFRPVSFLVKKLKQ